MTDLITEFAPAKVNLALHILGRRTDGYHELDSVVAFADVGDVLVLQPAERTELTLAGPFAADVPTTADNLVLKAHAALAKQLALPSVAFHLTKNLPVASGIGGGSADAAAALRGLLKLSGNTLDDDVLHSVAMSLGADVPVCLQGSACRMQGVGETITTLAYLPAKAILLVNPLIPCGTAAVFGAMGLNPGDRFGTSLDVATLATWRNDMTTAACSVLPAITNVLTLLRLVAPNSTVRMSGSGATCFALFDTLDEAKSAARTLARTNPKWWVVPAQLR